MERVLFTEEQKHNQWWLWLIMLVSLMSVLIPFVYGIYVQEVLHKPFGDNPMSTEGLIVVGSASVLIMVLIMVFMFASKLKIKITNKALFVSYPPLIRKWKTYSAADIEKYEIRKFKANREFGGYGAKKRRKYGTAYIISGNIGLQLYFKDGKKLLISTQKKQAIEYAMIKLCGGEKKSISAKQIQPEQKSLLGKKAKKILIICVIEIVIAILVLGLIQVFK